jgi:hypothetical protein
VLRIISSSLDLDGLIVKVATSLLDFRRIVFLAPVLVRSIVPCSTNSALTDSSSACPAGLLSSSSHSNAILNVL